MWRPRPVLRPTPGFCEFTKEGLQGKTPKEIQKIYDLKRRELIEQLTNSLGNILPLGEPIFLDVVKTCKIILCGPLLDSYAKILAPHAAVAQTLEAIRRTFWPLHTHSAPL